MKVDATKSAVYNLMVCCHTFTQCQYQQISNHITLIFCDVFLQQYLYFCSGMGLCFSFIYHLTLSAVRQSFHCIRLQTYHREEHSLLRQSIDICLCLFTTFVDVMNLSHAFVCNKQEQKVPKIGSCKWPTKRV